MLNQAVRRAPDSVNYRFYLGEALGNNGKFVEAAGQFRSLASVDPQLTDPMSNIGIWALSRLAYCQGEMGDWAEAFTTLQPAIGIAVSILDDLARFLANSEDYDQASFLYYVALLLDPGDAGLLHGAGYCRMMAGRLDEALELLRKAAKVNRDDPDIWYDLGLTLAKLKNAEKARSSFRKVLELNAKHLWAWYDLACLDSLEKKHNAAFRNLYKSIECGFNDKEYLLRDSDLEGIHKDQRRRLVLECVSSKGAKKIDDRHQIAAKMLEIGAKTKGEFRTRYWFSSGDRFMKIEQRYRGCLLGLAVGDALGTTLEFKPPGSFRPITDMIGGGPFHLEPGQWTDDTSMALCLAESLLEKRGFDAVDQLERYVRWWKEGHLSSTGKFFDIGTATREALSRFIETRETFCGSADPQKAGNGSLMRLAPVPMFFANAPAAAIEMAAHSSRTTHRAPAAVDACRYFAALIVGALGGASKESLLSDFYCPIEDYWKSHPLAPEISEIADGSFRRKEPPAIKGTGYVVHCLEAALWAFYKSDNFRDGCLVAANLGDDADTTAAVFGQLAGAYYGEPGIPESWLEKLAMRDTITSFANGLCSISERQPAPGNPLEAKGRNVIEESEAPTPFERSYWVVPGKFLAGAYPGDTVAEKAEEKLHAIIDAGIRCFVDLTSKDDRNFIGKSLVPYQEVVQKFARAEGLKISYHRQSITDLDVPSHEEMVEILDLIDGSIRSDLPDYVHCLGGIGRTGTVVGCWLVRHGIAHGEAALDCIRKLRRSDTHARISSPETAPQRRFICEWKEGE